MSRARETHGILNSWAGSSSWMPGTGRSLVSKRDKLLDMMPQGNMQLRAERKLPWAGRVSWDGQPAAPWFSASGAHQPMVAEAVGVRFSVLCCRTEVMGPVV